MIARMIILYLDAIEDSAFAFFCNGMDDFLWDILKVAAIYRFTQTAEDVRNPSILLVQEQARSLRYVKNEQSHSTQKKS